ncbi:hypothetical protein M514_26551, partial [Trichuris suis]
MPPAGTVNPGLPLVTSSKRQEKRLATQGVITVISNAYSILVMFRSRILVLASIVHSFVCTNKQSIEERKGLIRFFFHGKNNLVW